MYEDFSSFKEELKNRIDIVDVVGEFVELKKRGSNHVGLCPFHTEKTPSFSVNRAGQFYHCFGCGKGGDVIGFLMDITGMGFMEAVEQLAERSGLEVPKKRVPDSGAREKKELIVRANLAAAEYFFKTLNNSEGKAGMEYLLGRGLTPDTIKTFRLGYAPENPTGLLEFAKGKKVSPSSLEAAGILLPSKYGSQPYNRFGGRIIFPIVDQAVRVIGFGARLLKGDGAKYVNSPESDVYHKSRVLFGIHQAKGTIKHTRKAIVVEGYMDVISLHQGGIRNAIASSGTAFTVDQGRLIARMARDVILLFDGDAAGLTAAARGADNLLVTDLGINVVVLPQGHDPDSYIREKGGDDLTELLEHPMDLWEFKLDVLGKEKPTTQDRTKLAGEIADSISFIQDELKRDVYIRDMVTRIGVDPNSMRKAVNGRIKKRSLRREPENSVNVPQGSRVEREILASFIAYPDLARYFMEEAGSKPLKTPLIRTVVDTLFHRIVEGLDISPSALMNALSDRKAEELIASAAVMNIERDLAEYHIDGYLKRYMRAERAEMSRLIAAEQDRKKKSDYMKRHDELYEKLKKLSEKSRI